MAILRATLFALAATLSLPAGATFHTFEVEELYSNADGSVQYVVLKEASGASGQNQFSGRALLSSQGATTNTLVFPSNLPNSNTANRHVLIATPGFAALGIVTPDYTIPAGFLFTNGGTVNFAGVDSISFASLPTDGTSALHRGGSIRANEPTNFAGVSGSVAPAAPLTVTVVEYYNTPLDHYFMTASIDDINALDAGAFPGWARTQQTFRAYVALTPGLNPVCRFFIPPDHGSSHFFSGQPADCAALLTWAADPVAFPSFSGYVQEHAAAFFVTPPDATGTCPPGTVAVFRLWNQRFDSNHRYTTSPAIVDQMKARNFVVEGAQPNLAAMCAPP
ncbi:MAG: hypothetical protein ABI607_01505 [Betaproteobacteria bacterium]